MPRAPVAGPLVQGDAVRWQRSLAVPQTSVTPVWVSSSLC